MQRFFGQYNQNDRNSFERCALSGPQKHITKESDGFHNHSTQLTMSTVRISDCRASSILKAVPVSQDSKEYA